MRSIEYCLDELLKTLYQNWESPTRLHLDVKKFLTEMDCPIRHEFFVSLVDKLIKDGYAKISPTDEKLNEIDLYQQRTIITIEGYYFVKENRSFVIEKKQRETEKDRQFKKTTKVAIGGVILGAVLTALLTYLLKDPQPVLRPVSVVLPKIQIVHDTVYLKPNQAPVTNMNKKP